MILMAVSTMLLARLIQIANIEAVFFMTSPLPFPTSSMAFQRQSIRPCWVGKGSRRGRVSGLWAAD